MLRTTLFFLILGLCFDLLAQKYLVTPIDQSRGFDRKPVFAVTSDDTGYWWISAEDGLWRYNFSSFTKISATSYLDLIYSGGYLIAKGDDVLDIYDANSGLLQESRQLLKESLLVEDSEEVYIFQDNQIITVHQQVKYSHPLQGISEVLINDESVYAINKEGILYTFKLGQSDTTAVLSDPLLKNSRLHLAAGNKLICVGQRLIEIDLESKKVMNITGVDFLVRNSWKPVKSIFFSSREGYVYELASKDELTPQGLLQENDAYRTTPLAIQHINDIHEVKNKLIIASDNGLFVCRPIVFANPSPFLPNLYSGSFIPVTETRSYTVVGGILFQIDDTGSTFEITEITKNESQLYYGCGYGNDLWLGTQDGQVLKWSNNKLQHTYQVGKVGNIVFFINRDRTGDIWYCASPGNMKVDGISKITRNGSIKQYNATDGLASRSIVLRENFRGDIYTGGTDPNAYLHRYDRSSDKFVNLSVPLDFIYGIRFEVHDLAIDHGDTVWLGTTDGLLKYYEGQVTRVDLSENTPIDTEVRSVVAAANGSIWFATDTEGLFKYEKGHVISFKESSGLVTDIATYRSLSFDLDGRLWVGTVEGYSVGNAESLMPFETKKPVVYHENNSTFQPGKNNSIQVQSPEFPPESIQYKYYLTSDDSKGNHLSNLSENWTKASYESDLTLPILRPGKYNLKIKALQDEGHYWSKEASLDFVVPVPFYLSIWAIIAYCATGALILWGMIRLNTLRLKQENAKLENLVEERTNELKESNDQLISKNTEIDQKNKELKEKSDAISEQVKETRKRNRELSETIQKLKRTQESLIESEKMASIGILTAGLAHELNNPLSYVGGVVHPLRLDLEEIKPLLDPEKVQDSKELFEEINLLLGNMETGVSRASEIIKKLIDIAPKVYAQEDKNFDIGGMIKSTANLMRKASPANFQYDIEEGMFVSGNQVELNQVIINLVKNALDSLKDEQGHILITAKQMKDHIEIKVEDDGKGIADHNISKVFEPFFTTKDPGEGTGLGLYISYGIIKKHNGNLSIESAVNQGTKVCIILPV